MSHSFCWWTSYVNCVSNVENIYITDEFLNVTSEYHTPSSLQIMLKQSPAVGTPGIMT